MSNRLGNTLASPSSLWTKWDSPTMGPSVVSFPQYLFLATWLDKCHEPCCHVNTLSEHTLHITRIPGHICLFCDTQALRERWGSSQNKSVVHFILSIKFNGIPWLRRSQLFWMTLLGNIEIAAEISCDFRCIYHIQPLTRKKGHNEG